MNKIVLLAIVTVVVMFIAPSVANATCNGVTICGVNYSCGASDGVCPEDFSVCDSCSTPDPDCGIPTRDRARGGGKTIEQCRADLEGNYISSLASNEVFSTIEDRYCTDLHLYKLKVLDDVESVSIRIKLIELATIPPEGKVYNYYNFSATNLNNSIISEVEFRYRVPLEWITNNSVAENKVILYAQKEMFWERLDSKKIANDSYYNYYGAKSDSLGIYAIVGHGLDIWDVLEKLNLYYAHKIEFDEVLRVIDMYYSF